MSSYLTRPTLVTLFAGMLMGLSVAATVPRVQAALSGPSEHKGIAVDALAELSEETLRATIGLTGYTMRMRAVGIAPGGQIAQHAHADRPGIVTMVEGEWIEGQPDGETTYSASGFGTFPETEETVHWVYNRTAAPATALVCDIAKIE